MLPNHSPLTIAEQFGTLATLHPGRIDLGLGRAPGSDQNTMRALRRDPMSADTLPPGRPRAAGLPERPHPHPGRRGDPGQGHQRAALHPRARRCSAPSWPPRWACRTRSPRTSRPTRCRTRSRSTAASSGPPRSSTAPHVIAGVNVIAADTAAEAQAHVPAPPSGPGVAPVLRPRPRVQRRRGRHDPGLARRASRCAQMMKYSAVGHARPGPATTSRSSREHADADELIVAHQSTGTEPRLRSVELLADAARLVRA